MTNGCTPYSEADKSTKAIWDSMRKDRHRLWKNEAQWLLTVLLFSWATIARATTDHYQIPFAAWVAVFIVTIAGIAAPLIRHRRSR